MKKEFIMPSMAVKEFSRNVVLEESTPTNLAVVQEEMQSVTLNIAEVELTW